MKKKTENSYEKDNGKPMERENRMRTATYLMALSAWLAFATYSANAEAQCVDLDLDESKDCYDNCLGVYNVHQEDWDNDGQGDACDCDDGRLGENEEGIDCGGNCAAACAGCIPLVNNGNSPDKIDIVFVPDVDYGGDYARFRQDALDLINNGYFGTTDFAANDCKFNFWFYPQDGDYRGTCQAWDLPANYAADCGFADTTGIVFTGGDRACATGNVFSTPPGGSTAVHETGHSIFELADEYCCDGGYFQPASGQFNIYQTQAECAADSNIPGSCLNFCPETRSWPSNADCQTFANNNGLNPALCVGTSSPNWCNWRGTGVTACCVDGGDGWWKADAATCTMQGGNQFEPDCQERIGDIFADYPACMSPAPFAVSSFSAPEMASALYAKIVIMDFNITNNVVTPLNQRIVYNFAPDNQKTRGEFSFVSYTGTGQELSEVYINDPRALRFVDFAEGEPSMMMSDNIDFTVIVPFVNGIKTVQVIDTGTESTIETVDLSDAIIDFCDSIYFDDPQCEAADANGDGHID